MPQPDQFYRDKFILITGGSTGIGLALARQLAALGANIAITARRLENLEKALKEIEQHALSGRFVHAFPSDVSIKEEVYSRFRELIQQFGVPDILITCAGVTHPGEFLELSDDIFQWNMDVNYYGTFYAIRAVAPGMVERGSGVIVCISSGAGYYNFYGYSAYGASKYAVWGLADALRMELKPHGIQVSVVFPGDTDTPQLAYEKQFKPEITSMITGVAGVASADQTAAEIIRGVSRGKYFILPGKEAKLLWVMMGLLGRSPFNAYFDRAVRKALARKSAAKHQFAGQNQADPDQVSQQQVDELHPDRREQEDIDRPG